MLPLLKVFRLLLALVGVVALPAKDAEDVAPSTGRLVDIDGEVGSLVPIAEGVFKFCPVLVVLVRVTFRGGHRPSVFSVPHGNGPVCHSSNGGLVAAAQLDDTAKVVRVVVLLLEGGVGAVGVGVVVAAVERDVPEEVLGVVHGDDFVLFIITQQFLPVFYLAGTP